LRRYFPPNLTEEEKKAELKELQDPNMYTIGIVVKRDTQNVNTNITLCLFLIQFLTVLTFGIKPADVADRSAVILTTMLTVVAFK
jgi:hypothetical protein